MLVSYKGIELRSRKPEKNFYGQYIFGVFRFYKQQDSPFRNEP